MTSPVANLNNVSPARSGGRESAVDFAIDSQKTDKVDPLIQRAKAETLLQKQVSQNKFVAEETTNTLKGLGALDAVANFAKKFGKAACLAGGFACSTAAVLSMFFLNVKTLGLFFGIPAALFFYVATSLGNSAKKIQASLLITDPDKALTELLSGKINYLRESPAYVVKVIQSCENLPKDDSKYLDRLDKLGALRAAILVEKAHLNCFENEESLMYQGQMDDYLDLLKQILPASEDLERADLIQAHQEEMRSRTGGLHKSSTDL